MNVLDSLFKYVAPSAYLGRMEARDIIARKYAGAKQSPQTGILPQYAQTQNTELRESWQPLVSRTAQLVRDYPIFASAINNYESFVVGGGLRYQAAVTGEDGKPDVKINKMIEASWTRYAESKFFDYGERLTFYDAQGLAVRQQMETGDFLFRKVMRSGRLNKRKMSSRLSFSAIDAVTLVDGAPSAGNHMIAGIEVDTMSGAARKYHVSQSPDEFFTGASDIIAYDARSIIHGYKTLRPGQVRGVTPFASAILLAYHMQDYVHAEITAQKANAKFLAFVTATPGQRGSANNVTYKDTFKKYTDALEYASMQFLEPGETVTMNNTTRSSQGLQDFSGMINRMTAAAVTLPVEVLSQDYRDLNYTTLRAARNDFKQNLKPVWRRFISQFCRPVFDEWLKVEFLSGNIDLPGYAKDPQRYHRGFFVPEGIEQVDPVKETAALSLAVRNGFMSPQEAIMSRGKDPDRVIEEIEQFKNVLEEKGLEFIWYNSGGGMFPLLEDPDKIVNDNLED